MIPFRIKNSFSHMDSLTSSSFPPPAKIPIPIQLNQPFVISNISHYFAIDNTQTEKHPFVYSENFSTSKKLEIYCEVCPKGENERWKKFFSVFLTFEPNEIFVKESIEIELNISIIDADGRKCNTKETKVILDKVGRWGWADFIERDYLFDPVNNLLSNDQLKLLFQVKFDGDTFNVDITKTVIDEIELPPRKFDARTETISLTHKWTIDNFTQFPSSADESRFDEFMDSDIFSIPNEYNIDQFYLKVYPKSPNNYLGIFLFFLSHWRKEVLVHFRASLLDENGNSCNAMGCGVKIPNGTNWGWDFIDNDLLLDFANGLLIDDKLTILCEVKIINENGLNESIVHERVLNELSKLSLQTQNETPNSAISFSENITNAATENSLIKFAHKWTIENFKEIFQNDDPKFIDSRCFSPYPENEENELDEQIGRFYLRLHPKGHNEQTQTHVSVFLYSELETIIRYRIYILVNGKAFIQRYDVQHKMIRTKIIPKIGVGFPKFISHEKLLNSVNDFLLPDNKLTIFCEIETVEPRLQFIQNPDLSPKPQTTEFEHSWIIENFENYFANKLDENNKYFFLQSPNFTSPVNVEHEFHIRLYPNGFDEVTSGKLCIFLWPMCRGPPVKIYERVKVYDDNRVNRFIKESRDRLQGMDGNIGKYISSKEIIEKTYTNRQLTGLTGNNLTVCMQIKISEYIDKELKTDSPLDPIPTSKTYTRIAKFLHKWTVNNFHDYFEPILESFPRIQNNEIFIYFNKKIELGISMYPKGMDEGTKDKLVLSSMVNTHFVNPARWTREEVDAFELQIYALDDETGERLKSSDGLEEFSYRDRHWGLFNPEFIKTKKYASLSIYYELYIIEMSPESPGKLEISDNFVIDNFSQQWKVKRQRDIATSYTHVLTELVHYRCSYQWNVDGIFSQIMPKCEKEQAFYLDSPKFSPPENEKIQFSIRICPKVGNKDAKDICVMLCSVLMETDVMLQFKMSFLGVDGETFRIKDDIKRISKGAILEWSDLVLQDYLLEQNEFGKVKDKLTIDFEIDIFVIPESKRIPKIVIADKWTSFLDHEHATNLVIHFGGESKLYAHYNILAMASLFFNNIWTIKHKNMAHMENQIELSNIEDVHVFEELLKLIYSGKIEEYADKSLDTEQNNEFNSGNACERFLLSKLSLTIASAAVLYILANICKENELKLKFAIFIVDNFAQVMKSKAWQIVVECWPELMEDILKVSVENK